MSRKIYTLTLTEKQLHTIQWALYVYGLEDDVTSRRVIKNLWKKIDEVAA